MGAGRCGVRLARAVAALAVKEGGSELPGALPRLVVLVMMMQMMMVTMSTGG